MTLLVVWIFSVVGLVSIVLPSPAQNPSLFIEQELISPIKAVHPFPIEDVCVVNRSFGIYERGPTKYVVEPSDGGYKIPYLGWAVQCANNAGDTSHHTHSRRKVSLYVSGFSGGLKGSLSYSRFRTSRYCYHRYDSKCRKVIWLFWKVYQVNAQPRSFLADDHVVLPLERISLLLDSRQGSLHDPSLETHLNNLFSDKAKRPQSDTDTPESNHYQEVVSKSRPVESTSRYRHGGKFADDYGVGCIVLGMVSVGILTFWGCDRLYNGHQWSGWGIMALALTIGLASAVSGSIGCLPWDWHRCLCDDQQHSEQRDQFIGM
jgi:hypothetical protein